MRKDKALNYLRFAASFAKNHSKDRSTQVGTLFLDRATFRTLSRGYNGLPRGANDTLEARHERPLKYEYMEHAEPNAIFNAVQPILRGSVALTTEQLDIRMARALISVGAREVWYPAFGSKPVSHDRALALLAETGVSVGQHDEGQLLVKSPTRHSKKLSEFLGDLEGLCNYLSKDPSPSATMFLEPGTFTVLTEGYSGMPSGADDSQTHRYSGAERECWVEDSLRNAIYNRARPLLQGSIAVVTEIPCSACMRAIAAVGASQVVSYTPSEDYKSRWSDQVAMSRCLLEELGIPLQEEPRERV